MASPYRRGKTWWIKYSERGTVVRQSLQTKSYTEARREKSRIEHELDQGLSQRPSRLPLVLFLAEYTRWLRTTRTAKSYKNDISYLRICFGPLCEDLVPRNSRGKPMDARQWLRARPVKPIAAVCLEDITTGEVSSFLTQRLRTENLAPKTANRTREVLHRLFSYAIKHKGFRPDNSRSPNSITLVERAPEPAPQICFPSGLPRRPSAMDALERIYTRFGT